eukprot:2454083-Amphidinium_carterae.1
MRGTTRKECSFAEIGGGHICFEALERGLSLLPRGSCTTSKHRSVLHGQCYDMRTAPKQVETPCPVTSSRHDDDADDDDADDDDVSSTMVVLMGRLQASLLKSSVSEEATLGEDRHQTYYFRLRWLQAGVDF